MVNGKVRHTDKPLFFNYVFIRSSQADIYRMMTNFDLNKYSFLPMVRTGSQHYFPYLTDQAMEQLKWVARSYGNEIPVYVPKPVALMCGDRIRISDGLFKGLEATVITSSGAMKGKVMAKIDNFMWVPLFEVKTGQYEVIELSKKGKHQYARLGSTQIFDELYAFLKRSYTGSLEAADEKRLQQIIKEYAHLEVDTDILRCKRYAILLLSYAALRDAAPKEQTIAQITSLLPAVTSQMSQALLLSILYFCTDSSIWHARAHQCVAAWRTEEKPKPAKKEILRRLDEYDALFGH